LKTFASDIDPYDSNALFGYSVGESLVVFLPQMRRRPVAGESDATGNRSQASSSVAAVAWNNLNTTSEDYAPIKQLRLMRFNGTSWDPFGEARMPLICCMRFFIAVLVGCSCKMKPCIFKLAAHRPR
jgi:hypothetical protein